MKTMKKVNWFLPWNDEKEEKWLTDMSKKGWHLKSIRSPDNVAVSLTEVNKWSMGTGLGVLPTLLFPGFYHFEQNEPEDYIYRLDYFAKLSDLDNYQQLFEDAGWEFLGKKGVWFYFRQKTEEGNVQEIYSDNKSKIKKYRNNMVSIGIISAGLITGILIYGGAFYPKTGMTLTGIITLSFVYSLIRLQQRIHKLHKRLNM